MPIFREISIFLPLLPDSSSDVSSSALFSELVLRSSRLTAAASPRLAACRRAVRAPTSSCTVAASAPSPGCPVPCSSPGPVDDLDPQLFGAPCCASPRRLPPRSPHAHLLLRGCGLCSAARIPGSVLQPRPSRRPGPAPSRRALLRAHHTATSAGRDHTSASQRESSPPLPSPRYTTSLPLCCAHARTDGCRLYAPTS